MNKEERPIAFVSRKMTPAEKNYLQVKREALAITKNFYQYLWGRKFTLETDHKPLTAIFGPKQGVPAMAAARLQRWEVILSGHSYEIVYLKGTELGHADALSRLPVPQANEDTALSGDEDTFHFALVDELPVTCEEIRDATRKNPVLAKVTMSGWPNHVTDDRLKPYWTRSHELSVDQGCVLWRMRVVIPPTYQEQLLEDLHEGHLGITRMKSVGRSFCWWLCLDTARPTLETYTRSLCRERWNVLPRVGGQSL